MSTQPVLVAAPRPTRAVKPVVKTADFKESLARVQAPFAPLPARRAAPARPAAAGQGALAAQEAAQQPARPSTARRPPPPAPALATRPATPDAAFRSRIAAEESAGAGWAARNAASGAIGRYQMLPVALRDIGWQDEAGGWTARAAAQGVRSEADFLSSPAAQEAAMGHYLRRAESQLAANGALGAAGRVVMGTDGQAISVTPSGLVAAAHRRGAGMVARWLQHRTETPDAPVPPAARAAFAQVERRLRDFADAGGPLSPSA